MEDKTITLSLKEYRRLQEQGDVDTELIEDIAAGIKDILQGKIVEV